MPSYKLTHFDLRSRGEIIRFLFAAAGKRYEETRVAIADWPEYKKTVPTGFLPFLEIDGKITLTQSLAIGRYLAREFGFAGKTNLEQAKIDQIVNNWYDLQEENWKAKFEKDSTKQAELVKKRDTESHPLTLKVLEKLLSENNNGNGYFVGRTLTWADLMSVVVNDDLTDANSNFLNNFPKLKAHADRIRSEKSIAEYLKKRPQCPF